jgi:hypothetical protein
MPRKQLQDTFNQGISIIPDMMATLGDQIYFDPSCHRDASE